MTFLRAIISLLLSIAIPLPALAQPHVIAQLGTSPLVGQIASTAELRADVKREKALFEIAGAKLGLTPAQFAQFAARIDAGQLAYVTIPRRLDAMSWAASGRVYVLHDVMVPANTKGWETDLTDNGQIIALFVPARCGNLSIVRKPAPAVAVAPAAAIVPQPAPETPPPAMPAVVLPQAPAPTTAPIQNFIAAGPPVTHHFRLWPLLLIPIVAFFAGHGGTTNVPPLTNAPLRAPPPAPTPPPTGCTPAPH